MSAYDRLLEAPALDTSIQQEAAQRYVENRERMLAADDDVILEALGDALGDKRTRDQVIHLYRSGDLLAAMTVMHNHVPVYINEMAEIACEKALQEHRL